MEADTAYRASIAATEEEGEAIFAKNHDETAKIERKLSELVPEDYEAIALLRFVIEIAERLGVKNQHDMLKNTAEGLREAWQKETRAEYAKGVIGGYWSGVDVAYKVVESANKRVAS